MISEPVRNISRARNSGARNAQGEAFLFLDADTKVPADLLKRIAEELQNDDCAGGATQPVRTSRAPISRCLLTMGCAGTRRSLRARAFASRAVTTSS